ncbi:MAG: hypothetical protein K2W96_07770, partial [Gemmataceae bacterium]|nr:hypothetical protein [Gemmataceae bacterium]
MARSTTPDIPRRRKARPTAWPVVLTCAGVLLLAGVAASIALYPSGQGDTKAPLAKTPPKEKPNEKRKPTPKPTPALSPVQQAVAKGVRYLKSAQLPSGTWGDTHPAGLAALGALALIESGVPENDPHVAKALKFVREAVPSLEKTYELAVAVLLMDRLRHREDDGRVRSMLLRLAAGQTVAGGWSYSCPLVPPEEERPLLLALKLAAPDKPAGLFVQGPGGRPLGLLFVADPGKDAPTRKDDDEPPQATPAADPPITAKEATAKLPPARRKLPSVDTTDGPAKWPEGDDGSDNSNTQLATLALWAGRKRDVPVGRALARVVGRFRNSQKPTGGWGYLYQSSAAAALSLDTTTPSMTGAGLICLAVGWGLADTGKLRPDARGKTEDPAIRDALATLGKCVGMPGGRPAKGDDPDALDLYHLWTVERVAVLYGLDELGGK